jgi:hypothetical protein
MSTTTRTKAIDPATITFGIEIECYVHGGRFDDLCRALPAGWNVVRDGSLNSPPYPGCRGIEVVSPVLSGPAGLAEACQVARAIKEHGGRVNPTCGFHVHVGLPEADAEQVGKLVFAMARFEPAFFASTGSPARAVNRFCRSIKDTTPSYDNTAGPKYQAIKGGKPFQKEDFGSAGYHYHPDRYHTLNLTNLHARPVVEFRVFCGTTNPTKVAAYVLLCIGLVVRARATKAKLGWDLPSDKGATGRAAMEELLRELGWIGGILKRPLAWFDAPGTPGREHATAELRRLAAKFDGVDAQADEAEAA